MTEQFSSEPLFWWPIGVWCSVWFNSPIISLSKDTPGPSLIPQTPPMSWGVLISAPIMSKWETLSSRDA